MVDDPAALDGPLLAALWTRAVLAADPATVALCEIECSRRGTTATALVAATKKKDKLTEGGKRSEGARGYSDIVKQSQKNKAEGKKWDEGQASYKGKSEKNAEGYNPYRKKKGSKGGGQFTTKEGAETTDPNTAREKLQEDDPSIPQTSPGGAKIKDFRDGQMIYEDGTIYDAQGWRDAKGRAIDADGKLIEKDSKGGTGKLDAAKKKAKKDAERAAKQKERDEERAWDTAELRRKADAAAKEGNHAALLSILTRNETAARKERDFAKTPEARAAAEQKIGDAQKELSDAKVAAEKAKVDKQASDKTARETKANEERTAEYAEIVKNYPVWEKELRDKYADVGMSETELAELIIRDRARRVRLLPRKKSVYKGNPTANLQTVPPATAAGITAAYDPNLHPKGKDGKWIETNGLVDLFGMSGFQHGQRGHKNVQGQVTEIIPTSKGPIIRVKVTDPRWDPATFGETVDVKSSQVAQRVTPKAKLPTKAPAPDIAKPAVKPVDDGIPAPRAPTPNLKPDPKGPNLALLELPSDWASMDNAGRNAWVKDRMDTDLTAWRGEPTVSDFTGFDAAISFNLANTYRELANSDPETARRIDNPILSSMSPLQTKGLPPTALAVAHPGTAHPGGIGEKVGPAQIVFGSKYLRPGENYYARAKKQDDKTIANGGISWSTSSGAGDPSVTLIHEFGHQRQFRYLDIAMRDAGKAWSPAVREDGFGLIPDTSNWPETQSLRYEIPKLVTTKYGQGSSSEGFAEGQAERALGMSSVELDATFDEWHEYMGLAQSFPTERHWNSTNFDDLTPTEKDQFWTSNGQYLDLPGMRTHYPDTANAYDAWVAGKETPPSTGQPPEWQQQQADWDTEFGLGQPAPGYLEGQQNPAAQMGEMTPGELTQLDDDALLEYMFDNPWDEAAQAEDARRQQWAVDPATGIQIAPHTGEVYSAPDKDGNLTVLGKIEDQGSVNPFTGEHRPLLYFVQPNGHRQPLPYKVEASKDATTVAKWIGTLPGMSKPVSWDEGDAAMMPGPNQDMSKWIPGVGDVDEYLAAHPREPGEALFVWQGRIVDGLPPRPKHALMFEIRERYEPVPFIAEGMTRWRSEHGLPEPKVDISEIPANQLKSFAVAREFEELEDQSRDPRVQAVYQDFIGQSEEMFDFMTRPEDEGGMGVIVEFWTNPDPTQFGVGPYQDATEQAEDLRVNHRIKLEAGLGGQHEATMDQGQYDRFRAVHDVFGHAGIGGGFDRHGEYQAYLAHSSMYWGDGRRGMASEYHGVNSAAWSGVPGSPGTGKSVLLPEILIAPPWDADGNPVAPPRVEELRQYLPPRIQAEVDAALPLIGAAIPGPAQQEVLNITPDLAASLAYLADQAQLDHVFANAYEDAPYHKVAA